MLIITVVPAQARTLFLTTATLSALWTPCALMKEPTWNLNHPDLAPQNEITHFVTTVPS